MPILDKPITRAQYYASRVDKQKAQEKARAEEIEAQKQQSFLDKKVGTSEQAIFPNKVIEQKPYPYIDTYEVKKDLPNTPAGRYTVKQETTTITTPTTIQTPTTEKKEGILRRGYNNISTLESNLLTKRDQLKTQANTGYVIRQKIGTRAALIGIGAIKGATTPIIYPKKTAIELYRTVRHPIKAGKETIAYAKSNPWGFGGSFIGTGALFKGVGSVGTVARNTKIALTTDTVKSSAYLDVKSSNIILKGGTAFPTTKSVGDSIKQFDYKLGKFYKSGSASPQPLKKSLFSKNIVVGKGTGTGRTEGLYVAPYTSGSSYFFGALRQDSGYSFSVLPKFSTRPTLSIINAKSKVKRIPLSVLRNQKNVEGENLYLNTRGKSGEGEWFITGNTERMFNSRLPKAFKTVETEAVAPAGSILRSSHPDTLNFKFSYYRVPVKEYDLVSDAALVGKVSKRNIALENPFVRYGRYDSKSGSYYMPKKNVSLSGLSFRSSLSSIKSSSSNISPSKIVSSSTKYSSKLVSSSSKTTSYKSIGSSLRSKTSSRIGYSSSRSRVSRGYSSSFSSGSSNKSGRSYKYYSYIPIKTGTIEPPKLRYSNKQSNKKEPTLLTKKSSFKGSYAPTIEASLFNIKGKSIGKAYANTGLVIRPILRGRK